MNYQYTEIVDWGIIRRQWIQENADYLVVLEKHEEDRYTVKITHKQLNLEYYSYWKDSGKLAFSSLAEAQAFAADKLAAMHQGNYDACTPLSKPASL